MLRLLIFLSLAGLGYPPDDSILVTRESEVTLRWKLPGGKFRVELIEGGQVRSQVVESDRWVVGVRPGGHYSWRVTPLQATGVGPALSHFSVAEQLQYQAQGRAGSPGKNGTNGASLRVRVARDEAGLHLWIWDGEKQFHFVGLDKQTRFLISARGGQGGSGQDGTEFDRPELAGGGPGGSAGWGGNVEITTRDVLWRDYVTIDVAPGEPGAGGKGARYYRQGVVEHGPDGPPGQPGKPGRVVTVIQP